MKKLPAICCLILIGLLGSTAKGEKVFYCQAELATGFIREKGSWRESSFEPEKYTIKFNDDYSMLKGLPKDFAYTCTRPYSDKPNLIVCRTSPVDVGYMVKFNTRKMRLTGSSLQFVYVKSGIGGYLEDGSNPDTDILRAGTCQNFLQGD